MPGRPRIKPWFAESQQSNPEYLQDLQAALARLAVRGAANRIQIKPLDVEPGQAFDNVLVRNGVDLLAHPQTMMREYPAYLRRPRITLDEGHVAFLIEVLDRQDLSEFYNEVRAIDAERRTAAEQVSPEVSETSPEDQSGE